VSVSRVAIRRKWQSCARPRALVSSAGAYYRH